MHPVRPFPSFVIAATVTLVLAFVARAEEVRSAVKFSQPNKPGVVKIQLPHGSLSIQASDDSEVVVRSASAPASKAPRKDGLRVLTSSSSFSLTEKDNVVTLDAMSDGWVQASASFILTVPRSTSVVVQQMWGGDVACSGIAGDIEINGMNGSIRLDDVSGGIAVATMSGKIHANLRELRDGKALSFQSMNGAIVLRLPEDAKANLRVRTQNGSVLTDFEENVLVTKSETTGGLPDHRVHSVGSGHGGVLPPETREAIREAARVGAEAVREAAVAMREAAEAAREGAESARHAISKAPLPPTPPRPPRPPKAMTIPTITGGKLVTGTLNGGGADISIATMNGDVTLRRQEKR